MWVATADGAHAWQLTADSASFVFTSDFDAHNFWKSQIYRLDLRSGANTRLTRGDSYNEHPRYTPKGQVLWMTNADNNFKSDGGAAGFAWCAGVGHCGSDRKLES